MVIELYFTSTIRILSKITFVGALKMKILSVKVGAPTDDYSAWIRKIKVATLIEDLGHEMDFVIYTRGGEFNKNILANVPFKYNVVEVSPFNLYLKYFKLLKEKDYDLIFCNGQYTHAVLFLTKFKSPKFILDKHGDIVTEFLLLEDGFKYKPRFILWFLRLKLIDFLNLHFADKITCVSYKMIEFLSKKGFNSRNAVYVTNGIDLDHFGTVPQHIQEMKEEMGIKNRMVFTYVGAFEKWQGVDNFIEAAKSFNKDSEIAFVIVGGEKEFREGNIIFIPKVPQEEVKNYYALSDVLVLPRPYHVATEIAAPTKFPEYLAAGKPILTTNVGDVPHFVRKSHCGVVVKDNQFESLVEGILKFKKLEKVELKNMGVNSRKLAEKEFSIKKMADNLSDALENW